MNASLYRPAFAHPASSWGLTLLLFYQHEVQSFKEAGALCGRWLDSVSTKALFVSALLTTPVNQELIMGLCARCLSGPSETSCGDSSSISSRTLDCTTQAKAKGSYSFMYCICLSHTAAMMLQLIAPSFLLNWSESSSNWQESNSRTKTNNNLIKQSPVFILIPFPPQNTLMSFPPKYRWRPLCQ